MGPGRRAGIAFELSEQARAISIEGIRARDPRLSPEAARRILLRKLLGTELFAAAFPDPTST
jgi:hypothetical protein